MAVERVQQDPLAIDEPDHDLAGLVLEPPSIGLRQVSSQ
jgi:hypothetical protein